MRTVALAIAIWVASGVAAERVGPWEPFEVTMTARGELHNPYVEGLPDPGHPYVVVTFRVTSGEARGLTYTVPGFWDGGKIWKARFAAPAPGVWSYSSSSQDPGLDAVKGTFECVAWNSPDIAGNPSRHGFIRVARTGPRAGRYFEYADGTPFLWIGDTWWPFLKAGIPFARARQVIDDRASRGFTVGQVLFGANSATGFA